MANNAGYMDAQAQLALAQAAQTNANKYLGDAYGTARGDLTNPANNYYKPFYDTGSQANTMYANGLGLNGAAGNQAAMGAFQQGPGYQFAMDQGTQALNRTAASRGALAGGGQSIALQNYGQGMANQEYGNWLSKLGSLSAGQGMAAATGQTGQLNNLTNLDYGYGKDLAGVQMQDANMASQGIKGAFQADASANAQQNANLMSGILGGVNLAGKAIGGLSSMGGFAGLAALSDRRAKTDINEIGVLPNGLPVYTFRYKSGGPVQIGLMAQDVLKVRPDAVIMREDGYLAVDYSRAVE